MLSQGVALGWYVRPRWGRHARLRWNGVVGGGEAVHQGPESKASALVHRVLKMSRTSWTWGARAGNTVGPGLQTPAREDLRAQREAERQRAEAALAEVERLRALLRGQEST
jgi:hypothetical protein